MREYEDCGFCGHRMTAHNTRQFDGPVCLLCGCGDEFVIDHPQPAVWSLWREVGIVAAVAAVIMVGVLLAIQWLERMVLPW